MRRFPSGEYGRQKLQFYPAPFQAPLRAFAALVFPWKEDKVLLCDIDGRGWCIPSGRVEPEETSKEAAQREAKEEAGAILAGTNYIGCYRIYEKQETRWADCFAAEVVEIGELTMPEESKGVRLASLEELPSIYHLWNALTKMVFEHSYEVLQRARCRDSLAQRIQRSCCQEDDSSDSD